MDKKTLFRAVDIQKKKKGKNPPFWEGDNFFLKKSLPQGSYLR